MSSGMVFRVLALTLLVLPRKLLVDSCLERLFMRWRRRLVLPVRLELPESSELTDPFSLEEDEEDVDAPAAP